MDVRPREVEGGPLDVEHHRTTAPAWPILRALIGWVLGERWCALGPESAPRVPICRLDLTVPSWSEPPVRDPGLALGSWSGFQARSGLQGAIPGPRFWRGAPGLGRVRAARVAERVWRSGVGIGSLPGPDGQEARAAIRAVLMSIDGIGPITADRVSEWLHGPLQPVHSEARGP